MVCLGCGRGEARIDDDQLCATLKTSNEIRDLRGEDVFSDVAADQNDTLRFFEVHGFGGIDGTPESELIADVARSAALCECRFGCVRRPVSLHQCAEEASG